MDAPSKKKKTVTYVFIAMIAIIVIYLGYTDSQRRMRAIIEERANVDQPISTDAEVENNHEGKNE